MSSVLFILRIWVAITQEEAEADADAVGTPSRGGHVGMVSWGTGTLVGVFTGLLYGGAKEANANVVSCHPTPFHTTFHYRFGCNLRGCRNGVDNDK
jgi:hypothetical protein